MPYPSRTLKDLGFTPLRIVMQSPICHYAINVEYEQTNSGRLFGCRVLGLEFVAIIVSRYMTPARKKIMYVQGADQAPVVVHDQQSGNFSLLHNTNGFGSQLVWGGPSCNSSS